MSPPPGQGQAAAPPSAPAAPAPVPTPSSLPTTPGEAAQAEQREPIPFVGAGGIVVQLDDVSLRFGDVVGVEGISLSVERGKVLGVIGPSGAGKTTTIRLITGALAPDSGTVRVLGEDPRRFRRRTRERIGYMPQLFVLYPDLTARENIEFIAALFGVAPWRSKRRIDDVLHLVDLWEAQHRRASAMSGGMQRRLELACALVHQPALLILDEPTAGIDPILRTRVWEELDRLHREGVTILVTTQYVSEAEYCDDVALISDGGLVAHAPPQELRRLALGGEVIEVTTVAPLDARSLPRIEGVLNIRQTGPRSFLFVVEDAGPANPRINDAIEETRGEIELSREYRPTFDEVFTALVTAHAEQRDQAPQGEEGWR